ncbi:MAG: NTP transferase domain-containing protein [Bacilli bacterium]|nr:NTP transferase domain-containing protein [Bacilli bacterium]
MSKTVLVLAAGAGSRFGGPKQIEVIGNHGEFIMDYSIYDAIKAGFDKVVFVIKEEHYDIFKETVGKRIENKIKVEYAFQSLSAMFGDVKINAERTKPWGTTHAVLCAKDYINEPFIIINADDFYGYDSYKIAADFLDKNQDHSNAISVNYPLSAVDSDYGSVKRGVVFTNGEEVEKIVESKIEKNNGVYLAYPLDGSKEFTLTNQTPCAVNFFGFYPEIFKLLEEDFNEFKIKYSSSLDQEILLPESLKKNIISGNIKLYGKLSPSKWIGMTYKDEAPIVKESIAKLGYPENLWK